MDGGTIALTGVSGMLGQRLMPLLDAAGASRIVGLDVREPARRCASLDFHRVDIAGADLEVLLRGVDTVVHLAGAVAPLSDEAVATHINIEGTRRLLAAASRAGVAKIVRPSSAAVYGAWANNSVPLTEDAPLRPSPGYAPAAHDAECERMLTEWHASHTGAVVTTLRLAPVVGPGAHTLFARAAIGHPPVRVRGVTPPAQVVHVDDVATALALAVERDLDGAFNVAADGWLTHDELVALVGSGISLPPELARRWLSITWATGLGDAPPAVLPYLMFPWVIANDRLRALGWVPRSSNEEAIALSTTGEPRPRWPWIAGAAAAAALGGAGAAAWWISRRRRSGSTRPTPE